MRRLIVITLVCLVPGLSNAQFVGRWKKQRQAFTFGIGGTNFLGDLGGANRIGTNGIRDLELSLTRLAFQGGYRYQLNPRIYAEGTLTLGWLRGDDNLTTEPARQIRNLQFKSHILEGSVRVLGYILQEKSGHLYKLRGVRGQTWGMWNMFLFTGIGGFWFNPKGPMGGSWHKLRPLKTEGQGLPGAPGQEYSLVGLSIPFGIGIGRTIDKNWSVNLEVSMHTTFTDYIDDVSTDYFDKTQIQSAYGDVAAYFADPTLPENLPLGYSMTGQQRGDPTDNDAYMFIMVKAVKKINLRRRFRPKF